MAKKPIVKRSSKLFQLTEKIENDHDFVQHRVDAYADNIIVELPIDSIRAEKQVRQSFSTTAINELATSIEKEGLLYPILVMEDPNHKKKYILLVGESRLKAAQKLGWKKIPARVKPFIQNNGDRLLIQLTENIQRNNLDALDLAESLMRIKTELNITLDQLAKRVGRSLNQIKKYSMINNLSSKEKDQCRTFTFKELMSYITKKNAKSSPGEPRKDLEQLSLFKQTKTSLKMSAFKIDYKKENKDAISNKIKECEQFLREAKKRLRTLDD